jgi:hypothetical protein
MEENERNYRYDDRDYRNDRDYRDYRYDDRDYRNYREDYRRDYDRRGGRRNYRYGGDYSFRNSYHEELEMVMEDMREQYRKLEDVAEMAEGQDKSTLMKVAQKEKENYMYVKQLMEK